MPSINKNFFHDISSFYWSSTSNTHIADYAWGVHFNYGYDDHAAKSLLNYVSAVRGGQNQISDHLIINSPEQASKWHPEEIMPIQWEPQNISGNVNISISREGGKSDTFIPIASNTPNDGEFEWTVTPPVSVNCMLRIEPVDAPDKGTSQGLFSIINDLPPNQMIILNYDANYSISENASPNSTVAFLTSNAGALALSDPYFTLELLLNNQWLLKTSPTYNLNEEASAADYYHYTITVLGETATRFLALKIIDDKPTTICVPQDYTSIQTAINAAKNSDIIMVEPGTYVENINFYGKAVLLTSLYMTSGNPDDISQTIIDGNQNGSVVTFEYGEDHQSILSGFLITNGKGTYSNNQYSGGGITCRNNSSPVLQNVIITNNTAIRGGGIYSDASLTIKDAKIINNSTEDGLSAVSDEQNGNTADDGAGIYIESGSLTITSSVLANN
ncbi:MAG: hypothetical protein OMM_10184, partial [Candidatus Magnetoglobus multicellularis str. Araruama]